MQKNKEKKKSPIDVTVTHGTSRKRTNRSDWLILNWQCQSEICFVLNVTDVTVALRLIQWIGVGLRKCLVLRPRTLAHSEVWVRSACSVVIHCDGVFAVLEVAIGEHDTDITVLAAEAAKSATERRKLPKVTSEANEVVMTATSGKWQRSTNSNMAVNLTAYVATKRFSNCRPRFWEFIPNASLVSR